MMQSGEPGVSRLDLNGATVFSGLLESAGQRRMLEDVRAICRQAPLMQPTTPGGRKMTVRMTAAGEYGWVSRSGHYGYERKHPAGSIWPPIPDALVDLWESLAPNARLPECCLVNFYGEGARLGLHQDKDEADFKQPVLSVSLGDDGLFRVGGTERGERTRSIWLKSGDVVLLHGPSRLAYHGVDRIRYKSSSLLPNGGRLNLTLRVVT